MTLVYPVALIRFRLDALGRRHSRTHSNPPCSGPSEADLEALEEISDDLRGADAMYRWLLTDDLQDDFSDILDVVGSAGVLEESEETAGESCRFKHSLEIAADACYELKQAVRRLAPVGLA